MIAGSRLAGRYLLFEPIGAGGMATVWRGLDLRLRRPVAVKLLREPFSDDPGFVERFEREARHAASLSHPNVATVFDTGHDGDARFIVMELADGPTVADVLRARGRLPFATAVEIAAAAARALAAAHRRGLIHRDVKPANLLLRRDGRVLLADFGIARALTSSRDTLPGTVLGSIPYLSPEQARGEEASAGGDIFSLGVVLFEMLTGRLPWSADSAAALATVRLTTPPVQASVVAEGVPPDLDRVVQRALEADPARRYPSARAFAEALETWLRRFAATAPEPTPDLADTVAMLAAEVPASRVVASAAARPNPGVPAPDVVALPTGPPSPPTRVLPSLAPAAAGPLAPPDRRERRPRRNRRPLLAALLLAAVGLLAPLLALALVVGDQPSHPGGTRAPGGVALATPPPTAVVVPAASPTVSPTPTPTVAPTPTPTATPTPAPSRPPTSPPTPRPTPPPAPRATQPPTRPLSTTAPARSVAAFYDAVALHRWAGASALWSPRMRAQYPPDEWLIGRFEHTTRIVITRLHTISIDRNAGTARVAVSLTEYRTIEPSPRRFVGAWDLVRVDGRWLLDQPHF